RPPAAVHRRAPGALTGRSRVPHRWCRVPPCSDLPLDRSQAHHADRPLPLPPPPPRIPALLRHLRAALSERAPTCIYRDRGLVFRAEWGPHGGSRGRLRLLLGERNWPEPAEGCELGA